MTQTHIHLLINHLPIFGSLLGGFVLVYGLLTKSNHTKIAAYLVLIISSISAVITNFTGEAAEESVENIAGVSKNLISEHEEAAEFAIIILILLGVFSLIGLFLTARKSPFLKPIGWITLLVAVFSFIIIARTGYIGGQIRHTEINNTNVVPTSEVDDKD